MVQELTGMKEVDTLTELKPQYQNVPPKLSIAGGSETPEAKQHQGVSGIHDWGEMSKITKLNKISVAGGSKTSEVKQHQEEPEILDCDESFKVSGLYNISVAGEKETPDVKHHQEQPEILDCDESSKISELTGRECHLFLMRGGMQLTEPPKVEEWEQSKEIQLMDNELSKLPEKLRCPLLKALFLQRNCKLRTLPASFFDYMPFLEVLNLSKTRIKSLPESLFGLVNLKRFFLNHCDLLKTLSPRVGGLKNLEVLDLEGTEIMDLPKEVDQLTSLTCLEVSFYEPTSCRRSKQSVMVIPHGTMLALSHLEELNIDVSPDDERWNVCVEAVVLEVCRLTALKRLKFYFPRVELLRHFKWYGSPTTLSSLSHFHFTVGHHAKRIMSRFPCDVEFELEQYDRCLKYVNGACIPKDIKMVLRHSTAFFLDRHSTVKKLSEFGFENMMELECCVLGKCYELQVLLDCHQFFGGLLKLKLKYLYIYYMKNLRSMCKPQPYNISLVSLKVLTLRTCPQLTTIFTMAMLASFRNLEELTVDDCPAMTSLLTCDDDRAAMSSSLTCDSFEPTTIDFLTNLKKMSLHYLPELPSISNGLHLSPRLEWMSFYYCPNLKGLPIKKNFNENLKKIKGEMTWWKALEWGTNQQHYWDDIFVPIDVCD